MQEQCVNVSCIQESGPKAHNSLIKILDKFYVAMLPCPTVMLSCKNEFKIFQHCMYFFSDRAAAGL